MALSEAARQQKELMLRNKRRDELLSRVIALKDRPPLAMRITANVMRDCDRGELLALAFREWAADSHAIAALEPIGLLDSCGNVTVAGLDMAGALLRWKFCTSVRSPWRLENASSDVDESAPLEEGTAAKPSPGRRSRGHK